MENETQETTNGLLSIEEKKAYVERIDKKAKDENITIKHAAQKLGAKVWNYYKYKGDIKRTDAALRKLDKASKPIETPKDTTDRQPTAIPVTHSISLTISDTVMKFLEKEATGYATEPEIVAQLLLHDCVRGKMNKQKDSVKHDIQEPQPQTTV